MRYLGSKNKIAKDIVPIIQSYINEDTAGFIDCFCGGANIIDKISCKNKIAIDIHPQLIALLNYAKFNSDLIPDRITEEEYNKVKEHKDDYEDWYVGLVGFCSSFGAKYFGGYARNYKGDNTGDWSASAIKALKEQSKNFMDIDFVCTDFRNLDINNINNYVVYCDIPYKNTTRYQTKKFPYDEFYEFAKKLSENNTVIISEYDMPSEFNIIWEKEIRTNIDNNIDKDIQKRTRTEKLFTYNRKE